MANQFATNAEIASARLASRRLDCVLWQSKMWQFLIWLRAHLVVAQRHGGCPCRGCNPPVAP